MIRLFHRLRTARKGVAALEFAMTCPFMLLFMFGATDLGLAVWSQSCLNNAVAAGAEYAVITQLGGSSVTQTQINTIVQNATPLSGITGSTGTPAWKCITTTNGSVSLTASTSGATCADGSQSGLFVQVGGTYNYSVIGATFDYLGGQTGTIAFSSSIWVRIQ